VPRRLLEVAISVPSINIAINNIAVSTPRAIPSLSPEDASLNKQRVEAGRLLGIEVLESHRDRPPRQIIHVYIVDAMYTAHGK